MNKLLNIGFTLVISSLIGCSSSPQTRDARPSTPTFVSVDQEIDVTEQLAKIQRYPSHQQPSAVLNLAKQLSNSLEPEKCLSLLLNGYAWITELKTEYKEQALVCYHQLNPQSISDELFDETITTASAPLSKILAQKAFQTGQYGLAAIHFLNTDEDQQVQSDSAWAALQFMDNTAIQQVSKRYPRLAPWATLTRLTRLYGDKPNTFNTKLSQWKVQYGSIPVPTEVSATTSGIMPRTKITVLLPLTGTYAEQGMVIQQGILASYFKQTNRVVSFQFVDTAKENSEAIVEYANNSDVVIGPLLKDKVAELVPLINSQVPVLALNQVNSTTALDDSFDNRFYFALRVEDEAQQLAQLIYDKGFNEPLVVASGGSTSARMLTAFQAEWKNKYDDTANNVPRIIRYHDRKSMRKNLSGALDIDQSKQRIKHIESIVTGKVHSIARNRQDIDAIVLFASAQDTTLLNPIVEASVSPFSEQIPVFGGSRNTPSYIEKDSLRDLRNLHIVDIPWFIQQTKYRTLWKETRLLFPKRRDGLMRLYALGFDAFNLLFEMRHLRRHPNYTKSYLTGSLSISTEGVIKRRLSLGKIGQKGIRPLDER